MMPSVNSSRCGATPGYPAQADTQAGKINFIISFLVAWDWQRRQQSDLHQTLTGNISVAAPPARPGKVSGQQNMHKNGPDWFLHSP